jgi:hypothetical protein
MTYKNILIPTLIASFVFVSTTAPTFAASTSTKSIKAQNRFCEQLPALRLKLLEKTDKQSVKVENQMNGRVVRLEDRFTNRDTMRVEKRTNADDNLIKNLAALRTKYPDANDQIAIASFETTVKQAIETRRQAVDGAVTSYRNELNGITATASTTKQAGIAAYKQMVTTLLDTAQAACVNSTNILVIKEAFKTDLAKAQNALKGIRTEAVSIKSQVDGYAAIRKVAVENAEKAFKTTVETARTTLKTILAQ